MMKKIGILASHNGSGFDAIWQACVENRLDAKVVLVVSNNSDAAVLQKARSRGIEACAINTKLYPNENLDEKITKLFLEHECDYIFLSGYMKKLESKLVSTFENRIINAHPALLPQFGGKGMYGRYVHEAVLNAKEKISGCTIHFVNEHYDEGEYILQKSIAIKSDETVESLENKIKSLESVAIIEAFNKLIV